MLAFFHGSKPTVVLACTYIIVTEEAVHLLNIGSLCESKNMIFLPYENVCVTYKVAMVRFTWGGIQLYKIV